MLQRPAADEHAEYYGRYVALVPDGDLAAAMNASHAALLTRLRAAAAKAAHRYAPDKWSVAEVVQHLSDAERVFAYRMLYFARGGDQPLPPFDENAWAPASKANDRPFADVVEEYAAVRAATLPLITGIPAADWARRGTMSGNTASARAVAYIMAGHERHHASVLAARYGV